VTLVTVVLERDGEVGRPPRGRRRHGRRVGASLEREIGIENGAGAGLANGRDAVHDQSARDRGAVWHRESLEPARARDRIGIRLADLGAEIGQAVIAGRAGFRPAEVDVEGRVATTAMQSAVSPAQRPVPGYSMRAWPQGVAHRPSAPTCVPSGTATAWVGYFVLHEASSS